MFIDPKSLLLQDRLAPITNSMGFFEAPCEAVVEQFIQWQKQIRKGETLLRRLTERVKVRTVTGSLEQVIQSLLPLRGSIITRYLFLPTRSGWTAYFDNSVRGTDPTVIYYLPLVLHSRSVWMVANPHVVVPGGGPTRNRPGSLLMSVYGPEQTDWLNRIRDIRLYSDMGRWHFEQTGEPLPFEQTERYLLKKKTDRFDFTLLQQYLQQLGGLTPFDEDFYLPPDHPSAVLIDIHTIDMQKFPPISLEEARRFNGIE